jgi:hypothetical protein
MAATPTHAIVVKVTFKPGIQEAANKVLHEEVIPGAKKADGFVSGYWMHGDDNSFGVSVELFDSLANAQAELGRRAAGVPADSPVEIVSADVVEVVGQA